MSVKCAAFGALIMWPVAGAAQAFPRAAVESYLQSQSNAGYGYTVLISVGGKEVIHNAYGWTDSARKCTTAPTTRFHIASMTKSITATAVFQLKQQAKLRLDDSLSTFFADVPADKQAITIRSLLLHTSGLPEHYAAARKATRADAVTAILHDTLDSAPGIRFSYSNENFELLAAIVEVVSGSTYEKFVRQHILDLAGMVETKFWDEVNPGSDCSSAQANRDLRGIAGTRNWEYLGSGGIYSTVADVRRWFVALREGKLIAAEELALMWQPQFQAGANTIAFGWFASQTFGTREIWTRGNEDWGHNAVLRWFPQRELLVILETNSGERGDKNETANRWISDKVVELILSKS